MPLFIAKKINMFTEVEKMLRYRFWDKGRERSNRAAALVEAARGTRRRCPLRHQTLAYSGPPHDKVRCYVCLHCNAAASEPEIIDRGFTFEEIILEEIHIILDLDLQRQAEGNTAFFGGLDGRTFQS